MAMITPNFLNIEYKDYYEKYPFIFIVLLHAREEIPQNSQARRDGTLLYERFFVAGYLRGEVKMHELYH